jgi:hypothetical protein
MEKTRLVELTLYHKLQKALSRSRSREKVTSANFLTYNLKYNSIQTDFPVTVYVNSAIQNTSSYSVDYINGLINFTTALRSVDVVEVDYTYCPINIYDESVSPQSPDFKYPAVALYELNRSDGAYELGNARKELHPRWVIEVWAERGGERNDITDMVVDFFEEGDMRVIDYNIAFPTNADGTINTNYNEDNQIIGYMYCGSINYRKGGSLDIGEKPKFLTEIFADLTINF